MTIIDEREKTHGDYYRMAGTAQELKDVMRRGQNWKTLDDTEREALEMIATKIGRILAGNPHEVDHWRDIAGYAALIERWLTAGREPAPCAAPPQPSCIWPMTPEEEEREIERMSDLVERWLGAILTPAPEKGGEVMTGFRQAMADVTARNQQQEIDRLTIPPEALEAAAKDLKLLLADLVDADTRATELTDEEHIVLANSACLAMLRAWPEMRHDTISEWDLKKAGRPKIHKTPVIILPLTQEPNNG